MDMVTGTAMDMVMGTVMDTVMALDRDIMVTKMKHQKVYLQRSGEFCSGKDQGRLIEWVSR